MGNVSIAMEWFNVLISIVPTDPGVLARIGELFVKLNDPTQAFHSYSEVFIFNLVVSIFPQFVECNIMAWFLLR